MGTEPMRIHPVFSSLRFKTTLAITSALVVILGASTAFRYEHHRELELNGAQAQAAFTSNIIEAGLEHEMLTRDPAGLASIIDRVGQQPGLEAIYLLDAQNRVRFSPQTSLIGTSLGRRAPGLQGCGAAPELPTGDGMIYTAGSGEQLLRYCRPIVNQPECYGCHQSQEHVLGTLISDFSMTPTNQHLAADLNTDLLTALGTLVAVVLAVYFLLTRMALGKLERFAPILRRFGQGDLSLRLPHTGDDEISQLAASFNQMANGLEAHEQENARLYRELQEKESARAQLLQRVIAAQEEERKHLSRELHDDFSQSLTALTVTVQSALQTLRPDQLLLRRQLEQLQAISVETLGEASRWIQDLRPRLLDDMGLAPAIRTYAEMRLELCGTAVEVQANGWKGRLPPEIEITLFRVVQEAVANIAKHAHARHAQIRMQLSVEGHLVARIEDDGIGFRPGQYLHGGDGLRGVGLSSMRERVALLGGTLTIESTPGRGTLVQAEVPWKEMALASAS